jgi:hypothetical protein
MFENLLKKMFCLNRALFKTSTKFLYLFFKLLQYKIPNYFPHSQASTITWSGANTQISEVEKMRSRAAKPKENLYKTSLQTKLRYDSETVADDFPCDLPVKPDETATNKSLLSKLNPFKRKIPSQMKRHSLAPGSELDPQKYLRNTQNGRASVRSLSKNNFNSRRPSMFQMPCMEEEQDLLETTTIADLIRAIEQVHTDNVLDSDTPDMSLKSGKQRKLGTDHLTPPYQSLLTLGRPQTSHTIHGPSSDIMPFSRNRLNSCVSTPSENLDNNRGKILGDSNPFTRRLSMRPPPYTTAASSTTDSLKSSLKRRFSVRPSNLDKAPGQFHKNSPNNSQVIAGTTTPPQQTSNLPFQRKLSWRPVPSSLVNSNEIKKTGRQKSDSTTSTKP